MRRNTLLYNVIINALGLYILAEFLVQGLAISSASALLIAAIVLSLANMILRPILIVLSLPINLLTLGLLTLIINGFMLSITAGMVRGMTIDSFGTAVWSAILLSIFRYAVERLRRG